jgi:hypothetical protein
MKSTEGHREHPVAAVKDIGIAVRVGGEYGVYCAGIRQPTGHSKSSQTA